MRFDALDADGDDFLSKPIRPKHLIAPVQGRIRRHRDTQQSREAETAAGLHERLDLSKFEKLHVEALALLESLVGERVVTTPAVVGSAPFAPELTDAGALLNAVEKIARNQGPAAAPGDRSGGAAAGMR